MRLVDTLNILYSFLRRIIDSNAQEIVHIQTEMKWTCRNFFLFKILELQPNTNEYVLWIRIEFKTKSTKKCMSTENITFNSIVPSFNFSSNDITLQNKQ